MFCVFLLYFSAIAVLNVLALMNDGTFYGFNPIEAFSSKYIFATLLVFFSVIVAIFFSVSSSIFEHEKGFGVGLSFGEKEEKGYSRWLKEKEMKKAFKVFRVDVKGDEAGAGGVVLINDGKNMWVDDSENHTLVIGATGSGKTTAVVDPLTYSLCKHGESMVFTDPKGEIYKNHAELLKARGYKIIVLNFRSPELGNAWNPLTLPYRLYKDGNVDKAIELVDDVALNILQDKKASDPFWEKSASDYFSGCTLGLLEDAKEEQVNLNAISYMTTVGEEKFGAGSNYIKEYFTLKGESSSAYTFASNTINSPNETKGGILAVFRQKIRLFASREQLSEMLSYSDFNMRDIGKEKTAVFMVIHDEKTTYHALATIFIKQCYETLIDVAQECGGKLPVRTNFILDEFANMPPLKDVTTMVTAARSRQIRFTFIIQNFAQINEVYGKEDAETIRSNCGNLIYILTTELAALEEISKLCGEVKSKKDEKTESKPLVSVSDLQKMKMNEVIIIRTRLHPFKTKLAPAFSIDWGDKEFGKAEFNHREKREIQLFDIKEHVKLRKKSKMMDSLDPKKATPDFTNLMSSGLNNAGDRPAGMPPRIPTFEEFMAARNGGVKPASTGAAPIT
ncbi:MAG: type IV secretory system conjugative DNA transfer family protein, partial [Bacilli bacterium]|nr:type IV secretory system conjugative DNA transfer family protein [Bacilli bacterium]